MLPLAHLCAGVTCVRLADGKGEHCDCLNDGKGETGVRPNQGCDWLVRPQLRRGGKEIATEGRRRVQGGVLS